MPSEFDEIVLNNNNYSFAEFFVVDTLYNYTYYQQEIRTKLRQILNIP